MERAYVLSIGEEINPAAMPFELLVDNGDPNKAHEMPTLNQVKRKMIIQTLAFTKGRKIAAAKILGIERRKLNRLIEKLGIPAAQDADN